MSDQGSVLTAAEARSNVGYDKQRPVWRPIETRLAAQDLGGPEWEKALVGTLRVRGLLSRTEDTYRSWVKHFARSIAPE